jgi:hypothetical protein
MHVYTKAKRKQRHKIQSKENYIIYVTKIRFNIRTCKTFEETIRRGQQFYQALFVKNDGDPKQQQQLLLLLPTTTTTNNNNNKIVKKNMQVLSN